MTKGPPTIAEILQLYDFDPAKLQRVAHRESHMKPPLAITEPDPQWPQHYNQNAKRIQEALGSTMVTISHVGSTSIPNMPAKAVIDIDVTVLDATDESSYVPQLESIGFQFLHREPTWDEHRFFCGNDPISVNLHVWSPNSPETIRHQIFRDYLLNHPDDQVVYAHTKRECSRLSNAAGEDVMAYNLRKQDVLRRILTKAFRELGYVA